MLHSIFNGLFVSHLIHIKVDEMKTNKKNCQYFKILNKRNWGPQNNRILTCTQNKNWIGIKWDRWIVLMSFICGLTFYQLIFFYIVPFFIRWTNCDFSLTFLLLLNSLIMSGEKINNSQFFKCVWKIYGDWYVYVAYTISHNPLQEEIFWVKLVLNAGLSMIRKFFNSMQKLLHWPHTWHSPLSTLKCFGRISLIILIDYFFFA